MNINYIENYAKLIVRVGVNIQNGQTLVISSPVECADFARLIAKTAFIEGAGDVVMNWNDENFSHIRYMLAPDEVFRTFPDWNKDFYMYYANKGAAFVKISASDPDLMKDVSPERMALDYKTKNSALKDYSDKIMRSDNAWCVVSVPTATWAKRVFGGLPESEAISRLWEVILSAVRADLVDPVSAWEEHKANLNKRTAFLNQCNFKYLKYKNSLGTDLVVELPENHIWMGGADYTPNRQEFVANMPTEEIFTQPKRDGVNGLVFATLPLNLNGVLVEDFFFRFEKGRIVDFGAKSGYEQLKNLIETDDGSYYLGEIALVPYDSPISNTKILFLNTLFDENASCHLAVGKAYPCLSDAATLDKTELAERGVNDSLVHEDFMIGSSDLEIIGITKSGLEIKVFTEGNFSF